jgi:hypothetical protein
MPPREPTGPDFAALARVLVRATGASAVELGERVQKLWGGYGEIRRATLDGASTRHVIVKSIVPPDDAPRDDAEARSHRRKLRSYAVERAFYQSFAPRCGPEARVPVLIHAGANGDRTLLVLEDLDRAGFARRCTRVSGHEIAACLGWLAHFHARFLGAPPESLWKVGTYWHLATRPDELRALSDSPLRRAAPLLDERLNRARFRTLVHGDAKIQNFCFTNTGAEVAAVDFQYVGGGVGVKDVAYFLTSCLTPRELERDAAAHLDHYFERLRAVLPDAEVVETEWRELYPVACADFHRFMLGWAGEAENRDAYLESMTRQALAAL